MVGVTLTRRQVQEMITARDLRPSRALGQNFVADPNTVRRIARLAELVPGQRVVEIGAGLGALTLALAEAGARVTAVEIDRHLVPVLRSQVEERGVRVVEDDALTLDWTALLDDVDDGADSRGHDAPWVLVANLPYNVAVPVIVRVLEEAPAVASMLVMVQREVGERLAARAGDEVLRRRLGEGGLLRHRPSGRTRPGRRLRTPAAGGVRSRPPRPP